MKNLFLNCALTQDSFTENEEIIVIPVTNILKEDGTIYLGTSFISTFTQNNPLGFDSLSTNKEYKQALNVLKSYLKDISLITNKSPLEVAQGMANNSIILHNFNRITNSTHPWQEHELNFIFIKKNEFEKRKNTFKSIAQDISNKCIIEPFNFNLQYNNNIKIDVKQLFNKIYSIGGNHLNHLNIHFLRSFYIKHIYNQEKENIVKMSKHTFEEFIQEFQNMIFINSLYDSIIENLHPLKKLG